MLSAPSLVRSSGTFMTIKPFSGALLLEPTAERPLGTCGGREGNQPPADPAVQLSPVRKLTARPNVKAAAERGRDRQQGQPAGFPRRPPAAFLPARWGRLISANAQPDRRLYEVAVLSTLRERLRGSNIWVDGSRDWRAFEDHRLPKDEARLAGIDGEADPATHIPARATMLHDQITFVAACAERAQDGPPVGCAALRHAAARAHHRGPGRRHQSGPVAHGRRHARAVLHLSADGCLEEIHASGRLKLPDLLPAGRRRSSGRRR